MDEVKTYLPVPIGAKIVKIRDTRTDDEWYGKAHNGVIYDHAGFIDPQDVGFRFRVFHDGHDVTETYM